DFFRVPYIKQLGLWIGANENTLYPSIRYNYSKSFNQFILSLHQTPQIYFSDYGILYEENQLQDFDQDDLNRVDILNSKISTSYNSFVQTSLFYNVKYSLNQRYYIYQDTLYKQQRANFFKQKAGFELNYSLDNIRFFNKTTYQLIQNETFDFIPYLPQLENVTSLEFMLKDINVVLNAKYLSIIMDEDEQKIEDKIIFDISFRYFLNKYITLKLNAENLLNKNSNLYPKLPQSQIKIYSGINWKF
ncbi:MAG: hypothetical protein U9N34_01945, partial [Candidatus Cloacimonadota bacterium]|nr:hypothetical protein [Candidatus Cloacimonadota bacterium]